MAERLRLTTPKDGRATLTLTRDFIRRFVALVRKGLPADGACDYLGCTYDAYWEWIRRGESYVKGNFKPKQNQIYGEFYMAFRRAWAEYRLERVRRLHNNKEWYRELAILERRDRRSFGRNEPQGGSDQDVNPSETFL